MFFAVFEEFARRHPFITRKSHFDIEKAIETCILKRCDSMSFGTFCESEISANAIEKANKE